MGSGSKNIISFGHINVNVINPHDGFIELKQSMDILTKMETGVDNIAETKWNTTSPSFCKYIRETIRKSDYANIEMGSNMDKFFESSWKLGRTLVGYQENGPTGLNLVAVIIREDGAEFT